MPDVAPVISTTFPSNRLAELRSGAPLGEDCCALLCLALAIPIAATPTKVVPPITMLRRVMGFVESFLLILVMICRLLSLTGKWKVAKDKAQVLTQPLLDPFNDRIRGTAAQISKVTVFDQVH